MIEYNYNEKGNRLICGICGKVMDTAYVKYGWNCYCSRECLYKYFELDGKRRLYHLGIIKEPCQQHLEGFF